MAAEKLSDAASFFGILESGNLAVEFMQQLQDLNSALQESAGGERKAKGQITLTIDVEIEGVTWHSRAEIKTKKPKTPRPKSYLFVNDEGVVMLQHPKQHDMFARPITADR